MPHASPCPRRSGLTGTGDRAADAALLLLLAELAVVAVDPEKREPNEASLTLPKSSAMFAPMATLWLRCSGAYDRGEFPGTACIATGDWWL